MPFNLQHIYTVHLLQDIFIPVKNMISTLLLEGLEYIQRLRKQIFKYYMVV